MTLLLHVLINDAHRTVHREIRLRRDPVKREEMSRCFKGGAAGGSGAGDRPSPQGQHGLLSMEGPTKQVLKVGAAPLSTGVTAQDAFCKTRVSQIIGKMFNMH